MSHEKAPTRTVSNFILSYAFFYASQSVILGKKGQGYDPLVELDGNGIMLE
jgi:hypothetical protein